MRECIIAAMDNGTNRQAEYEPPGDTYYTGYPAGVGDNYLKFFADNVRPTLDFNFRTLTAPGDTLIGGSSMGGLISIYFGYETNLFGGVLAMSPAITRAPNYTSALWDKSRKALRLYVDTGSNEGSVGPGGGDYWNKPWEAYAIFLRQGYAVNRDLLMRIGCGAGHNETAWSARFPEAARFLLDVRREANALAQAAHPPGSRGWTRKGAGAVRRLADFATIWNIQTHWSRRTRGWPIKPRRRKPTCGEAGTGPEICRRDSTA
jgi:predicted alpha/beta superfamily hydrolase